MDIVDVLGNRKDATWLMMEWGCEIDTTLRRGGADNFQIVEVREVEGPAVYRVTVQDRNGAGWAGRIVGRYYPSAPNSWPGNSKPENVPAPPEGVGHVVFGQTASNGNAEFGVGTGDYAGPGDGVTAFWLAEWYAGTDVIRKLGMAPNTNHRTLAPTFRYVPGGLQPDPIPPVPEPVPVPAPPPPAPVPAPNGVPNMINDLLGSRKWVVGIVVLIVLGVLTYLGTITKAEFTDLLKWIVGILFTASAVQEGVASAARAKTQAAYYRAYSDTQSRF